MTHRCCYCGSDNCCCSEPVKYVSEKIAPPPEPRAPRRPSAPRLLPIAIDRLNRRRPMTPTPLSDGVYQCQSGIRPSSATFIAFFLVRDGRITHCDPDLVGELGYWQKNCQRIAR